MLHPDTVQDHEITIVADLVPHEYVKVSVMNGTDPFSQVLEVQMVQITEKRIEIVIIIAGEEVIEAVHVQDHVTAEMVFEAENLRLTKKNYWPLLRKMQLG